MLFRSLRAYSRYLNANGLKDANIEVDFDYENDLSDIRWDDIDSLSNNYRVEVFPELIQIIKKISSFCDENVFEKEKDDTSYERIDVNIDTKTQEISFTHYYSWFDTGDGITTEFSLEEYEELGEIFEMLEDSEINQGARHLRLDFNGSGDSGYIEDLFDNGSMVPSDVEDWAYSRLEGLHGGWEINEGSQGNFEFNLENKKVHLNFSENYQQDESKTFFEESFAK